MAKKRAVTPVGQGRASLSLGAKDPRWQRNTQAAQATEVRVGRGLTVDNLGRSRVQPARRVKRLQPGASPEDMLAKINEIVTTLQTGGFLDDGRQWV